MRAEVRRDVGAVPRPVDASTGWPVYWGAIWVGTLAALAVTLIVGLGAIALGAHQLGAAGRIVTWHQFGIGALIFSVAGAFFAFVVGGWVATKIGGILRPETGMLHGAIVWLLAVPFLVGFAALGAGEFFGWWGGLAGTPVWATPSAVAADPNAAAIARNSALGAITALLLGLVGSVIGGWMASGEPMSLRQHVHAENRRAA